MGSFLFTTSQKKAWKIGKTVNLSAQMRCAKKNYVNLLMQTWQLKLLTKPRVIIYTLELSLSLSQNIWFWMWTALEFEGVPIWSLSLGAVSRLATELQRQCSIASREGVTAGIGCPCVKLEPKAVASQTFQPIGLRYPAPREEALTITWTKRIGPWRWLGDQDLATAYFTKRKCNPPQAYVTSPPLCTVCSRSESATAPLRNVTIFKM